MALRMGLYLYADMYGIVYQQQGMHYVDNFPYKPFIKWSILHGSCSYQLPSLKFVYFAVKLYCT